MAGSRNDARYWSIQEVLHWLKHINKGKLEKYSTIFSEEEITGEVLLSLNDKLLKEMGIKTVGHRIKILNEITRLKQGAIQYKNHTTPLNSTHNEYNKTTDNWEHLGILQGTINEDERNQITKSLVKGLTGTVVSEDIQTKQSYGRMLNGYTKHKGTEKTGSIDEEKVNEGKKFDKSIPSWEDIAVQSGIKYIWNPNQYRWMESEIHIKIGPTPFDEGSLRDAFYALDVTLEYQKKQMGQTAPNMNNINEKTKLIGNNIMNFAPPSSNSNNKLIHKKDLSRTYTQASFKEYNMDAVAKILGYRDLKENGILCVAKQCKHPHNYIENYFNDVRSQCESDRFAKEYNKYDGVPKKIKFLNAYVVHILKTNQFYCLEEYLHGSYSKYLGNDGYVDNDRNTPSAFAHYTFVASQSKVIICDLQGVGDLYTDPQIHTFNSKGFGLGNRGILGFNAFTNTHLCNAICKHLKLPKIMIEKCYVDGTTPHKMYMDRDKVKIIKCPYFEDESLLYILPERLTKDENNMKLLSNAYHINFIKQKNGNDYDYRQMPNGNFSFPKRIPTKIAEGNPNNDDQETTCCWCTIL